MKNWPEAIALSTALGRFPSGALSAKQIGVNVCFSGSITKRDVSTVNEIRISAPALLSD
jgi:hypothetical protein